MTAPLQFTFDEAAHIYRDAQGVARPSVSQVIKSDGLISFAGISPEVLNRKAQLGTLVHKVTEMYDNGENLNDYEIPDEVWPFFDGWVNFRNDSRFEPQFIEAQSLACVHGMYYGMRLDAIGPINGEEHIIEKKCGSNAHPAWGVQMAGYDLGFKCEYRPKRYKRAAVQLGPQFPRGYKTHPYDEPGDYTVFLNALANSLWKVNKGLFQFEPIEERMTA